MRELEISRIEEIQACVKNESQCISFYGKEHQEDVIYDFLQTKKHIFDWKAAHISRSENQDLAKQDVSTYNNGLGDEVSVPKV